MFNHALNEYSPNEQSKVEILACYQEIHAILKSTLKCPYKIKMFRLVPRKTPVSFLDQEANVVLQKQASIGIAPSFGAWVLFLDLNNIYELNFVPFVSPSMILNNFKQAISDELILSKELQLFNVPSKLACEEKDNHNFKNQNLLFFSMESLLELTQRQLISLTQLKCPIWKIKWTEGDKQLLLKPQQLEFLVEFLASNKIRLRVDLNSKWKIETLTQALKCLPQKLIETIDYIEDPQGNASELRELSHLLNIAEDWMTIEQAKTKIVKPSLELLINILNQNLFGKEITLTSLMDGPFSINRTLNIYDELEKQNKPVSNYSRVKNYRLNKCLGALTHLYQDVEILNLTGEDVWVETRASSTEILWRSSNELIYE